MKIEEGKFYRCRQGFKIGPMRKLTQWGNVKWAGDIRQGYTLHFYENGTHWTFTGASEYDLIEEWVYEPASEALALLTPDPVATIDLVTVPAQEPLRLHLTVGGKSVYYQISRGAAASLIGRLAEALAK